MIANLIPTVSKGNAKNIIPRISENGMKKVSVENKVNDVVDAIAKKS